MTISGSSSAEAERISAKETPLSVSSDLSAAIPGDCRRIRDLLALANYTEQGVCGVLGIENMNRLREKKLPALLRRTVGGAPLETLARLFVLGQPADIRAAQRAIAPMTLEEWREIGLIELKDSSVVASVQLRCCQDLVFAYDFARRERGGLRQDYVMGVSPSSLVLAGMTVRKKNSATLDLGSGCGIQAILAAPHSERVVGIDCNPRAIAVSRFNANLNGISNVEFREGDMFEPVRGETFDLIVSNPPFIISPENRHFFLNSGLEGDEICHRIVKEAPQLLNEGGYCILNANWAVIEKEDWRARLANWFEGAGCNGLIFAQDVRDPGEYAAGLIEVGNNEEAECMRLFDLWMDYYSKLRIVGIGQGVIVMRRAGSAANWFAVESCPTNIAYPSGEDVARLLELRTFLNSLPAGHLLDVHLKLAANVRFEQICEAANGAWRAVSGRVRRAEGLEFSGALDGQSAAALVQWDGTRPLREDLRQLAAALNTDYDTFVPQALPIVRRLVEQGFVVPAGDCQA